MIKRSINKFVKNTWKFLLKNWSSILIISLVIAFSIWLMASTFGYKDGEILIKAKLNSDFLSHIPLIRSFSMGENFPPEYPHFPGSPIKYHFLFYALVGLLEKFGLRIDIALNLLSIIGFAGLLICIFLLAKKLTKSNFVGIGAILTIIFNSSLSWIYYFFIGKNHLQNLVDLFSTKLFGSFGPYDDNIISAFWNLNIYTNQRHLAFSFLLMFLAIWLVVYCKGKKKLLIALLIIGIMSWMHKAVLMIAFIILGVFFFAFPQKKKRILITIFVGMIFALPGLLFLNTVGEGNRLFNWQPGFLFKSTTWWEMRPGSDLEQWIIYWFFNMGILPILAISGSLLMVFSQKVESTKNIFTKLYLRLINPETAWFIVATIMFVIANLFNFGTDMTNNHKLITFTIMIWGVYAYLFLKTVFDNIKVFGKIVVPILIIFLLIGGICDIFPINNDEVGVIDDIEKSKNAQWVVKNSQAKDVFLNLTSDFYFVMLSGRKIYLGVPYFNWSLGYPENERVAQINTLLTDNFPRDKFCPFLRQKNIQFFYIKQGDNKIIDEDFSTTQFLEKYNDGIELNYGIKMYKTDNTCGK